MLKRHVCIGILCALALSWVAVAGAQNVPQPVVRMGNSIEIADDVWVNFIGQADIRFQLVHNRDFESGIQDRPPSKSNTSTVPHSGSADIWWSEARLGADMQYKKHLKLRVLFENQKTWDGNRVDNGFDLDDTPTEFPDGRNLTCGDNGAGCVQRNTTNLERLWIDYSLPNTPLRFRIGSDLWAHDQARVVADDDPRAAVYIKLGNLELSAAAVMEHTSLRIGRTNDFNDMYYNFGAKYDLKPWRFALDATYFRYRWSETQKIDTVLIMPSVTGSMGIVSGILQPMFQFGSVDTRADDQPNYDVSAFGFIGQVEVNLGKIRPFMAVVYGSGDGDSDDTDLKGFFSTPNRQITLTTGGRYFSVFTSASSWGARDVNPPAMVNLGTGFEFMHTVANPWHDRLGNGLHEGVNTTYSNPGTLLVAPGAKFAITKGHNLNVYYIYRRVMKTELIEQELLNREEVAVSVDPTMSHELVAEYSWTPSPWFDFRLTGQVVIPGEGVKDIASAQVCNEATGERCKGDDVSLLGQIRFRARF